MTSESKRYQVLVKKTAEKTIDSLPSKIRERIIFAIDSLGYEPRPDGCKKMTLGTRYRIRVGEYRVIYEIEDAVLVVLVVRVGHRKDVYR